MRSANPFQQIDQARFRRAVRCGLWTLCAVVFLSTFVLAQVRPAEEIKAARMKAEKLADDGKYQEAITTLKNVLNRLGAGNYAKDAEWLRDLEEEKEQRELAESLRDENRIDEAIKVATLAIDLKRKRNGPFKGPNPADARWLTDLRNNKVSSEMGLSLEDLTQILQMEYRDKWFDYKTELHDGGKQAEVIAKAAKSLAELKAAKGEKHPDAVAAQAELKQLETERKNLLSEFRKLKDYRDRQYEKGDYQNALPVGGMCVDLKQKIYGDEDLTVAISLAERARMEQKAAQWGMAEHHFKLALAIISKLYGPEHWRTKDAQVAVNESRMITSEFEETRKRIQEARSMTFKAARLLEKGHFYEALRLAEEDEVKIAGYGNTKRYSYFAANQTCLTAIFRATGLYSEAESRQRHAIDILEDIYGEEHPDFLVALNTLFELNKILGDHAQALTTARRSLAVTKKVWGPAHGELAVSLNNLGEAELAVGRVQEARVLFVQALQLSEQHFKTYGQLWTTSLMNLAEVHRLRGEYDESARLLRHVVKNRSTGYGPKNAESLEALFHLAEVQTDAKKYASADDLFRQILESSRIVHGPKHVQRAQYLSGQARLRRAQGDDAKAEPLLRECLEIERLNLDATFSVLSERQQLAMTREAQHMLSAYVDLAVTRKQPGEEAYRHVLGWKGAVLGRQQQIRLAAGNPELAPILKKYQETSRELATLALAVPNPQQRDVIVKEIARLSKEKERLEGDLSGTSGDFRKSKEPFTIDKLKGLLPPDAVLIDFVEYADSSPTAPRNGDQPQRRLVAFIIRPGRPVEQIALGDTLPIRALGEEWRSLIMRGGGGVGRGLKLLRSKTEAKDAAPQIELRRRLWEPLEPHLAGAKLLLLSPDGVTAKLPLAALPGRDPTKYLIEEMALVVVPSPSQLANLSTSVRKVGKADDMSLLVVGDVDFGAPAGTGAPEGKPSVTVVQRSAPRFGDVTFSPLPGTGREAKSIAKLFHERFATGKLSELLGAMATEGRLRESGPGHRYLHLATHGFFAPELATNMSATAPAEQDANVTDLHPGLLSGIAMAGANPGSTKPAADKTNALPDDGILTALEVASLDLGGVELAILSACETGLGKSEGGEGLLGLQRGFQVAGAKSTVASLWKVDDSATQVLMIELYRNLWEKKLSKLESLRQAQLTMLREYDSRQQKLVARGLKLVAPAPTTGSQEPVPLAPYYWAAFMLSGDWR